MARARRQLSELITEIQSILGETNSPFFTSALLTTLLNQCMDERLVDLMEQHEGWGIEVYTANLVADQATYPIPEGVSRVKRIFIVSEDGDLKRALDQDRQIEGTYLTGSSSGDPVTYRILDQYLALYPAPSESIPDGLELECEVLPARLVNDADKIPLSWPLTYETLLVLDTAIAALDYEAAQGEGSQRDGAFRNSFEYRRDRLEKKLSDHISERSFGRVISKSFDWGG